jgi:hypothetical protein
MLLTCGAVANSINRYSMSLRANPKFESDGSLVILIPNESPGSARQANWLPAPKSEFHLMLRLYWPDENEPSILDGSWVWGFARRTRIALAVDPQLVQVIRKYANLSVMAGPGLDPGLDPAIHATSA